MPESKPPFNVKANGYEFSIGQSDLDKADYFQKTPTEFNLIHNNRSVNAILLGSDAAGKKVKLEIDGEPFEVEIKDELDQMLDQMGYSAASTRHVKEIKAPMPGMVISIDVSEGQEVQEGDRLLILSAMKMENSILISAPGKIKKIRIEAGQAVDKGQILIDLE